MGKKEVETKDGDGRLGRGGVERCVRERGEAGEVDEVRARGGDDIRCGAEGDGFVGRECEEAGLDVEVGGLADEEGGGGG